MSVLYHTLTNIEYFKYIIKLYRDSYRGIEEWNQMIIFVHIEAGIGMTEEAFRILQLDGNGIRFCISKIDLGPYFKAKGSFVRKLKPFSDEEKVALRKMLSIVHVPNKDERHQHNNCYADLEEIMRETENKEYLEGDEIYLKEWWDSDVSRSMSHNLRFTGEDLIDFLNVYAIPVTNRLFPGPRQITVELENVYYVNKRWFSTETKKRIFPPSLNSDPEYSFYDDIPEKKNERIETVNEHPVYQTVDEDIVYLDYIYDFYNFGEFWDCLMRLILSSEKHQNLPLFHVGRNRITQIQKYFDALGFVFPTDYKVYENNGKLYHFKKKIYVSVISGRYRGYYDLYSAFYFNKYFNDKYRVKGKWETLQLHHNEANSSIQAQEDQVYNLYLARGRHGRSIRNESKLVDALKEEMGFIVLDGSESLDETLQYFSNARLIVGVHGSLMKNMIWCQKNAILLELAPSTRHQCFYNNCKRTSLDTIYMVCDADDEEQLVLKDAQMEALINMIRVLCDKVAK